ncbi:MAG TPA: 3-hydroxyacyl-CoA dehydrogenase family protein [Holophagaceae bacterium]|nr:3-hydroxyacyl-CoA dehydrogenase family protein [Holophagaceae bacterium]
MRLGILGPGTLGLSLARHAAERGMEVRLMGRDQAHADRGLSKLQRAWERTPPPAPPTILASPADASALQGLDALLECLPEDPELKASAWRDLAPRLDAGTLRLTGTSSLPVGSLDQAAGLGGRLMGFHLFVPVARMRVVELVVPEAVPGEASERAAALGAALDLKVARVSDQAGFAAARMALAQGLEAMRLLEAGAASAEDLDALMALGYGHPVGPLELSDRVGLDLRLRIAEHLFQTTGEARFAPPRILREKVAKGEAGRRSGQGFFAWGPDGKRR